MAEAILNAKGKERFEAASAGSQPAARVNPLALQTLHDFNMPWSGHAPRNVDGLQREHWDFVITVCDRAKEACPIFPGQPVLAHWGMPDPAEVAGDEAMKRLSKGVCRRSVARFPNFSHVPPAAVLHRAARFR